MKWQATFLNIILLLFIHCAEIFDTDGDKSGQLADITLLYPGNNHIYASGFFLQWYKEPSDHFFAYKFCINTQSGISEHYTPYHTTFIQSDTSLLVRGLEPNTTYYGKLFVYSSTSGTASEEFSITTKSCTTGVFTGEVDDGMVFIPAGSYYDHYDRIADIGYNLYMDMTEITEAVWDSVMSDTLNSSLRAKTGISWYEAILFCNKRSKRVSMDTCYTYSSIEYDSVTTITNILDLECTFTTNGYRLPTEDEWEYAYRAGVPFDYFWGKNFGTQHINDSVTIYYPSTPDDTMEIRSYAWSMFDSVASAQLVAQKSENRWKLYDMSGNTDEYVWDWFDLRPETGRINYHGPDTGTWKIKRGGTWNKGPYELSVIYRGLHKPYEGDIYTGFRTVRLKI